MIGYVTIGVSDMERAKAFYANLFADMGAKITVDMERIAFIGKSMAEPMVAVCIPYDEQPNHPGNGNISPSPPRARKTPTRCTTRR